MEARANEDTESEEGAPAVAPEPSESTSNSVVPFDAEATNAGADAAIMAASQGHATFDESGLCIDGVHISAKRQRELDDDEQDKIYEMLCKYTSKLARRVQQLEGALTTAHAALDPFASKNVPFGNNECASPPPSEESGSGSGTVPVSASSNGALVPHDSEAVAVHRAPRSGAASMPRAFVLASNHKHAYLNRIRLLVQTWAAKELTLAPGGIANCSDDSGFPHRVRRENDGAVALWVETSPRKFNLKLSINIMMGTDRITCNDDAMILHHANAMLSKDQPKPTELKFTCYLLNGNAPDGYDPASRPKTSVEAPLFKHQDACLINYNGQYVASFFHSTNHKPPVTAYSATMTNGQIVFKDICFADQCLSSGVASGRDASWRLCIRATHPALCNMMNFCVMTPPFFTGRRVRAVKPKRERDPPAAPVAAPAAEGAADA